MANIYNAYNQNNLCEPVVREANWVEESAMLAATGEARGTRFANTADRVIGKRISTNTKWISHQESERMEFNARSQQLGPNLNSRQAIREAEVLVKVTAQRDVEEEITRKEKEADLNDSLYGNRTINRQRILQSSTTCAEAKMPEVPLTLWNTSTYSNTICASRIAVSNDYTLHHKHTLFSTPIEHSRGGIHHQHTLN